MEYLVIIILTGAAVLYFSSKYYKKKYTQDIREELLNEIQADIYKESENLREREKLKNEAVQKEILKEYERQTNIIKDQLDGQINLKKQELSLVTDQYTQIQQAEQAARLHIDENIKDYELKEREKITRLLESEQERLKDQLNIDLQKYTEICESKKLEIESDLLTIQSTLDDFKLRQAAINEEILRRKQIEEQEEFYKISISKSDQEDIQTLAPVRSLLHNREAFDKLIYDMFIKRPTDEMIKRVLKNESPAGIYKITYLPTGEFYIGRSTNIKTRWGDHVKTASGLKGCAHSTLHTMMEKYGIWNFSFEVIEVCEKDKLSEKEKFYIDLYGADGLINMKAGG